MFGEVVRGMEVVSAIEECGKYVEDPSSGLFAFDSKLRGSHGVL